MYVENTYICIHENDLVKVLWIFFIDVWCEKMLSAWSIVMDKI